MSWKRKGILWKRCAKCHKHIPPVESETPVYCHRCFLGAVEAWLCRMGGMAEGERDGE